MSGGILIRVPFLDIIRFLKKRKLGNGVLVAVLSDYDTTPDCSFLKYKKIIWIVATTTFKVYSGTRTFFNFENT